MKEEQRIAALEEEVKVLKNEIKLVLLDLREHYLNLQSPFQNTGKIMLGKPDNGTDTSDENANFQKPQEANKSEVKADSSTVNVSVEKESDSNVNQEEQKHSGVSTPSKMKQPSGNGAGKDNRRAQRSPDTSDKVASVYSERGRKRQRQNDYAEDNGKVDLVVIAALTQWVDQATAMLGKERAEALVDISHAMKRVPTELKDVLVRFIRLSHHKNTGNKTINAKDYLGILAQLDSLFMSNRRDDALLSVLSMMKESTDG